MNVVLVDANIILRYLLADHPQLSAQAKSLFLKAEEGKVKLYCDEIVIAEVIWVLSSLYKTPKGEIVSQLEIILSQNWTINPRKNLILESLNLYSSSSLSYIDCWLLKLSEIENLRLETFDRKLRKKILH
jgi:predicted nucleic acid-binding protein